MIRLIADDLTGALDTAAAFSAGGPIRVALSPATAPAGWRGPLAINTGNRDRKSAGARRAAAAAATAHLPLAALAFCKIDSVLRGSPAIDIAAAAAALQPARIVIAPAFPAQGRITRDGRQWRDDGNGWTPLAPPLARLAPWGEARKWAAGAAPPQGFGPGVHVCDAQTDAHLDLVAQAAMAGDAGRTLHVGAAGLAAALAARLTSDGGAPARPPSVPALLIFGTPHPATHAQLAALSEAGLARPLALGDAATLALAAYAALAEGRPALLDLSRAGDGMSPRDAARAIGALMAAIARMPPPPLLFIGGGATLAALLRHLRALALEAEGFVTPGVALARIVGGAWDGVSVVAKSGGFGAPDLLARLIRRAGACAS